MHSFYHDFLHCRADFRSHFKNIAEIRSLVSKTRLVALTATATSTTIESVCRSLCMRNVARVSYNPDRPNIELVRIQMPCNESSWSDYLKDDAEVLKSCRLDTQRRIYFCRTIEMVCRLYEVFENYLGAEAYVTSSSFTPENRLFAMYHSESAKSVKEAVLRSLIKEDGTVRRVFATQSLSMGVDCPNIREVVFWGPPKTIDEYFQEAGRAGRDGLRASALLLFSTTQLRRCNSDIKTLCCADVCLRKTVLLTYGYDCVESRLHCCSVCSSK